VERRCVLEIQDGSQITGSSNNFAGFTGTHVVSKNNTAVYDYVRYMRMSRGHGRLYRMTKIQDVRQVTGSRNISETVTYTIIPTANLRHSTMANSQYVYLGDYNNDRQSEMAAETANT